MALDPTLEFPLFFTAGEISLLLAELKKSDWIYAEALRTGQIAAHQSEAVQARRTSLQLLVDRLQSALPETPLAPDR